MKCGICIEKGRLHILVKSFANKWFYEEMQNDLCRFSGRWEKEWEKIVKKIKR